MKIEHMYIQFHIFGIFVCFSFSVEEQCGRTHRDLQHHLLVMYITSLICTSTYPTKSTHIGYHQTSQNMCRWALGITVHPDSNRVEVYFLAKKLHRICVYLGILKDPKENPINPKVELVSLVVQMLCHNKRT